jgi:hypothetical protein
MTLNTTCLKPNSPVHLLSPCQLGLIGPLFLKKNTVFLATYSEVCKWPWIPPDSPFCANKLPCNPPGYGNTHMHTHTHTHTHSIHTYYSCFSASGFSNLMHFLFLDIIHNHLDHNPFEALVILVCSIPSGILCTVTYLFSSIFVSTCACTCVIKTGETIQYHLSW